MDINTKKMVKKEMVLEVCLNRRGEKKVDYNFNIQSNCWNMFIDIFFPRNHDYMSLHVIELFQLNPESCNHNGWNLKSPKFPLNCQPSRKKESRIIMCYLCYNIYQTESRDKVVFVVIVFTILLHYFAICHLFVPFALYYANYIMVIRR